MWIQCFTSVSKIFVMSTSSYLPIYNGQPVHTAADPYGFRPWNRRVAAEGKKLVLSCEERELRKWYWPLVHGIRVPPSELQDTFQKYDVRGPGCLCSLQDTNPHAFTEAAIFFVTSGRLRGEYVATCANRQCKYWVLIERLYIRRDLPVKEYHRREPGAPVPPPVIYVEDDDTTPTSSQLPSSSHSSTPQPSSSQVVTPQAHSTSTNDLPEIEVPSLTLLTAKEEENDDFLAVKEEDEVDLFLLSDKALISQVILGKRKLGSDDGEDVDVSLVKADYPPLKRKRRDTSPMALLLRLDSTRGPGITEKQFLSLFVKCTSCRKYMTRQIFKTYHFCDIESEDVYADLDDIIDLTRDSDN
ncbi:hypothetical protein H0H93_000514 [Arthromyces matolae]|nr:hypothetical protein H0H93_000514 [Arthromyces matolae]